MPHSPWCFRANVTNSSDNCFVMLDAPLSSPPIDDSAVELMVKYFKGNININGTGAVIASPGDVPALNPPSPGFYEFHWIRDSAMTMSTLLRLTEFGAFGITDDYLRDSYRAYIAFNTKMEGEAGVDAHGEPKWVIRTGRPFEGGWCRPQTDGPALRALSLMMYANSKGSYNKDALWKMIKFDLDWLAKEENLQLPSCDLWEEGMSEKNLLWNKLAMQASLYMGVDFAIAMKDGQRAANYSQAAEHWIGDTISEHYFNGMLTECPANDASDACRVYNKFVDGAVILSLIHTFSMVLDERGPGTASRAPTSVYVASTVEKYNIVFCGAYPINQQDSLAGHAGVLYGRYSADVYGGGNPWHIISAALATLFYQAAYSVASGVVLSAEEVGSWKRALRAGDAFIGSTNDFLAAGDAVLLRVKRHVAAEDHWHLWEQVDKNTGKQYNAKDLTWSYAEVLFALWSRLKVVNILPTPLLHV